MRIRARTAERLRLIALAAVISAIAGIAFAARMDRTAASLALGATIGGLSGLALASFEVFAQGPAGVRLRHLPLLAALVLRTAVYGAAFLLAGALGPVLLRMAGLDLSPNATTLSGASLLLSFAAALVINFYFTLRGLLGARTMRALMLGRYRRPREELRIVLFLDLVGSTRLAERLGNVAFHGFLSRVVTDITDPILEAGGEIYRYVGDEVIVTWPFAHGVRDGACIACVVAIDAVLAARAAGYERDYGAAPRLRGALHAGPVIVGEMGDAKREIVLIGDTMNTAARIEEACRATGHDFLASAALAPALDQPPPGVRVTALGPTALRGKAEPVALFALARA
ncbi:MAG: hypothetical protein JNL66_11205 [Alphaproteobacteria bacterium]|nr:hypothetical protein [Alphaproteobacteria bacterium]